MIKLIEVFSGKTKSYSQEGVNFKTAIVKQSVQGDVQIDRAGIVGNEIANHKNALYAFTMENYCYWQENVEFDIPWTAGLLGENLLLSGISESEVFIGDFLHIGEVVLQVSGCRTPCANLLWRLNASSEFLSKFQLSGHSGFYLEVIKTGSIRSGDIVIHKRSQANSISIKNLAKFFMDSTPTTEQLKQLINITGMGQQMLSMLTALLNSQVEKQLVRSNRWQGWKKFTIANIINESRETKSFYLTVKENIDNDGNNVAGYKAGQFLTVKLQNDQGEELIRCWSISDSDEALMQYRVTIKRQSNGLASNLIHDHYKKGDSIEAMAPAGLFNLKRDDIAVPVILISAGVGITPMISMLKSHTKRLDKKLPTLYFIHSTKNANTHLFKEEVDAIVNQHDNIHRHYIYTRADQASRFKLDYQQKDRLDSDSLKGVLADIGCWFADKWIALQPNECHYYVCGPEKFIKATQQVLSNLDVEADDIFYESFEQTSAFNIMAEDVPANINFNLSQQNIVWQPETAMSLLEMAQEQNINTSFSCRSGQCGLCATKVNSGEVKYQIKPSVQVAENHVLLCCTTPVGDLDLEL